MCNYISTTAVVNSTSDAGSTRPGINVVASATEAAIISDKVKGMRACLDHYIIQAFLFYKKDFKVGSWWVFASAESLFISQVLSGITLD